MNEESNSGPRSVWAFSATMAILTLVTASYTSQRKPTTDNYCIRVIAGEALNGHLLGIAGRHQPVGHIHYQMTHALYIAKRFLQEPSRHGPGSPSIHVFLLLSSLDALHLLKCPFALQDPVEDASAEDDGFPPTMRKREGGLNGTQIGIV